jgi:hypothetical protein
MTPILIGHRRQLRSFAETFGDSGPRAAIGRVAVIGGRGSKAAGD